MFRLLIKDLRVSPMRTFLTGFSMFVGIISMIAAVLAGTLGRDALQAVNAQIYGYAPIYAMSVSGMQLRDSEKMEHFFELLERIPGDTMLETNCKDDIQFVSLKQLEDLENKREFLYRKLTFTDNVFTTSAYNRMYNIPVSEGRWFCDSDETAGMEIVVNKAAAQLFPTSYMAASLSGTLALIPFNKVGVVNDGKDWPVVYVNIQPLLYRMPEIFTAENAMLYYHGENMGLEKIQSCIEDVLFDSVEGRITNASVMANGERYDSVIALLQMGLSISAMLLLFVSILGQINIGLASLEQRTHELLIRRALGATKVNIVALVLGAQFILSVLVCAVSIAAAMFLVNAGGLLLPKDSPIVFPGFPLKAAVIAVIVSVCTALLGGAIPAIKASRLEPALALR